MGTGKTGEKGDLEREIRVIENQETNSASLEKKFARKLNDSAFFFQADNKLLSGQVAKVRLTKSVIAGVGPH